MSAPLLCAHHELADDNATKLADLVVDGYSLCLNCGYALMRHLAEDPGNNSREWLVIIDQRGFV